ncbi:hypothetical protein BJV82DRAFT_617157 [Fennellomyces sp. T-0311]|nr:hypothetical protein BJV82DRAFT_617157 [Fennellomyces sp. T-0311]
MLSYTEELLERNVRSIPLNVLMRQLLEESRSRGDIEAAELLFNRLLQKLELEDPFGRAGDLNNPSKVSRQRPFTQEELSTFRKSIATLVRYSKNPERARKYTLFLLTQTDPPLRDQHTEITCLINIIYVYCNSGSSEHMKQGLDFVKLGLERGLKLNTSQNNTTHSPFRDQASVFATVSLKILRYHHLYPSPDGLHLQDRPAHPRRV